METLWLCGSSGIGKSVTGWALWSSLVSAGIPTGFVDIDQLGMCYPEPPGDPARFHLQARNLAGVVAGHRSAGARCLVVAGCADPRQGPYRDELPTLDLTICLLTATDAELTRRFTAREGNDTNLAHQLRESAVLNTATFPDLIIDTTAQSALEAAATIRAQAAWPRLTRPAHAQPAVPGLAETAHAQAAGSNLSETAHAQAAVPSPTERARAQAGLGEPRIPEARPAAAPDLGGNVLWVSGATCTGKSSAAFPVHLRHLRDGIASAYVDLEQLAICGPTPSSHEVRAQNLAAVWANYRQAGAEALVMVGPAPDEATVRTYLGALPGAKVTLRRLHATPDALTERVLRRGRGEGGWHQPGDPLRGRPEAHLRAVAIQAAQDAQALENAGVGERVDTDNRTIAEVADALHASMNW